MFGKVRLSCGMAFLSRSAPKMASAPRRRSSSDNMAVSLRWLTRPAGRSESGGGSLDRRARQHRLAQLHHVAVVKRVPGRDRVARVWLVVENEVPYQSLSHAELHIRVDMRICGIEDLRDQDLVASLEDQ